MILGGFGGLQVGAKIHQKSINKGIKNKMQVWMDFRPLWNPFWVDFWPNLGPSWSQVGAKLVPSWHQKRGGGRGGRGGGKGGSREQKIKFGPDFAKKNFSLGNLVVAAVMCRGVVGLKNLQGFGGLARIWHVVQTRPAPAGAPDPVALRAIPATVPWDVWLVGWWLGGFTCKSTSQPANQ